MPPRLGVNIDHVATLREARKGREPDPVWAAAMAELGGAEGITIHLREDRRHIQARDLRLLRETVQTPLNLEAAATDEILRFAVECKPDQVTFVPESRNEVTTEGGLNPLAHRESLARAIDVCREHGIVVSLFLDPDEAAIETAARLGAEAVELHTGTYALAAGRDVVASELERLRRAGDVVVASGLRLHAGHGLNYLNVGPVAAIASLEELNIGHAIVSRSVFVGMERAVAEMKRLMAAACTEAGMFTRPGPNS